ncbi:hypothetical protein KBD61_02195 [Patescibacteria group bacterium]|nr:hypothetical protein [Patescibacteria group bacterium]MBP9709819.1 hypothetical protein [Patescibacteria group bacterium]
MTRSVPDTSKCTFLILSLEGVQKAEDQTFIGPCPYRGGAVKGKLGWKSQEDVHTQEFNWGGRKFRIKYDLLGVWWLDRVMDGYSYEVAYGDMKNIFYSPQADPDTGELVKILQEDLWSIIR